MISDTRMTAWGSLSLTKAASLAMAGLSVLKCPASITQIQDGAIAAPHIAQAGVGEPFRHKGSVFPEADRLRQAADPAHRIGLASFPEIENPALFQPQQISQDIIYAARGPVKVRVRGV